MAQMTAAQCKAKLLACKKNCPTPDQCDKLAQIAANCPCDASTFITNLIALLEKDGPGAATLVTDILTIFGL